MYSDRFRQKEEKRLEKKDIKAQPKREKAENKYITKRSQEAASMRKADTERGRTEAREFMNQSQEGLTPQQRSALQYEAERQIHRGSQTANRQLLGEQSQKGILGKGGVKYAQQRGIQRDEAALKGQVHRDLDKLNADTALKKMAAVFNVGQGEASQGEADREKALNELRYRESKREQKADKNTAYRQFSRV